MSVLMPEPKNTLLGKDTVYSDRYNPDLLQPIPRALGRDAIGDHDFRGTDIWRLYELSWLNEQGIRRRPWVNFWYRPARIPLWSRSP